MKESREQKEFCVLESKTGAAFGDPAFAQNHTLLAAPERFANQRPFFETDTFHFVTGKLACGGCPSISTSTTSPGFMAELVCGVPVKMRSPGCRVIY